MATVDELLADPSACLELADDTIPCHAILIVEYVEPDSDDYPGRRRLAYITDEHMPPWLAIGMLKHASVLEVDDIGETDE